MAVSVGSDLSVRITEDVNVTKMSDAHQALRASLHKGEPKAMGVSQVMLGLMVMIYSIPLYFTEFTQVVTVGTPWWSGLVFITAGAAAIVTEKHCSIKSLRVCVLLTAVSILVSLVALLVYIVDLIKNPEVPCVASDDSPCDDKHHAIKLSRGVKSSLFLFTLTQTAISSTFCFLFYRERQNFTTASLYTSLRPGAPPSPTSATPIIEAEQ